MLKNILQTAADSKASDILIIAGSRVGYKVNGVIVRNDEDPILYPEITQELVEEMYAIANHRSMKKLIDHGDDDFSCSVPGIARLRINALRQRGSYGLIIRVVFFGIPDYKELNIPETVMNFVKYKKGLVLITGTSGSGKSTTLSCLVDQINKTKNGHVITIEDPIEYLHKHDKSIVTQRELDTDTESYSVALRAALRESPDVILLGEMRDEDTIRVAITSAETGHFIISTLHTMGAANTIDRIIDAFPSGQQNQIRTQLALVLEGIVSQQLIPGEDGKLKPVFEILIVNNAVRNLIRENKIHQIDNLIVSSSELGMQSIDQSLLELVKNGTISEERALEYANNRDWLAKRINKS